MRNDNMHDYTPASATATHFQAMSESDFAALGLNSVAYVKKVAADNGDAAFGIFAANGEPMGMAANHDVAFAGLRQHDIEPMSVH